MTRFFIFFLGLTFTTSTLSAQDIREVTATLLNVRKGPGTAHAVIGQLKGGDQIKITGQTGNWLEFKREDQAVFVHRKYLKQVTIIKKEESAATFVPDQEWTALTLANGEIKNCFKIDQLYDEEMDNFLRIVVSEATDVIVKLMNFYTGKCIRAVFIQGGTTFSIEHIPEGQYFLKIAYGNAPGQLMENGQCKIRFQKNVIYEKGEEILNYNLSRTDNGYQMPSYELFLDVTNPHDGQHYQATKIEQLEFDH